MDFSADGKISPIKDFDIRLRKSKPTYDSWGFHGPQYHQGTGYLSYADLDNIYIFYTDAKKDVVYIDIKDGSHRTIKRTNFDLKVMYGSGVKVGHDFFIASDRLQHGIIQYKQKTYVWKGKKEHLLENKEFTSGEYTFLFNRSGFFGKRDS